MRTPCLYGEYFFQEARNNQDRFTGPLFRICAYLSMLPCMRTTIEISDEFCRQALETDVGLLVTFDPAARFGMFTFSQA